MDENKKRALSAALSQIEKQYGKGAVIRMGDRVSEVVPVIRRARCSSIWRWASAACRAAASSKSMVRNPRARPR